MSVVIGEYTNTDKIRGAIGFTVRDVPDQFIVDRDLGEELLISLYKWMPDHATLYTAWQLGGSDDEKQYARQLRKYSTFMCAFHLCSGLELLAVQAIGDSKATAERFTGVKLEKLRSRIEGIAESSRSDLITDLGLTTASTTASIFSAVPPASDPVVGS